MLVRLGAAKENVMEKMVVDSDLVKIYEKVTTKGKTRKKVITVFAWGDELEVGPVSGDERPVSVNARAWQNGDYKSQLKQGFISAKAKLIPPDKNEVVKFSICDVQQGDASVLETPKKKILFVDCGENKLFARYLAARYSGTKKDARLPVEAVLFTHGDKDHYGGLLEIAAAEENPTAKKKIFIHPKAILHNGLVRKGPKDDAEKAFGKTVQSGDQVLVTELVDDISNLKPSQLSKDYAALVAQIKAWQGDKAISAHGGIAIQRLSDLRTSPAFKAFSAEGVKIQVLGPIEQQAGAGVTGLPLLRKPKRTVPESQGQELDANMALTAGYDVSQTVNGNSIVLLVTYGNIRLLLTGDINQQAEEAMLQKYPAADLRVDVLKAPHHGSADFLPRFLQAAQPVVSVISSGDEQERTEYIHPRATLVGSLGKYSRVPQPLVFCTELAAFMKYRGLAGLVTPKGVLTKDSKFYALERTSFGIVHFCFSKDRMLVFTHSGKRDLKEAYAFKIDASGKADFEQPTIV